jgi:hypothetical protein
LHLSTKEAPVSESVLPAELRRAVEQGLRPVRPLRAPWKRALTLLPFGALLLAGVPWYFGLRGDAGTVGGALLWGLSALQLCFGMALIGAALHEAVPARSLSWPAVALALAAGLGLMVAVTLATDAVSSTRVPPRLDTFFWGVCFGTSVLLGGPVLVVSGWLASRALPLRPEVAGVLYGMGSGLLVEAGWRLYCHISDPVHVLLAHGGSVLALSVLGALLMRVWERVLRGR